MLNHNKSLVFVSFSGLLSVLILYCYFTVESQLEDLRRDTRVIQRHLKLNPLVEEAQDVIDSRKTVNNNPLQTQFLPQLPSYQALRQTQSRHSVEELQPQEAYRDTLFNNNLDDDANNNQEEPSQKLLGIINYSNGEGDEGDAGDGNNKSFLVSNSNPNIMINQFIGSSKISFPDDLLPRQSVIVYNRVPKTGSTTLMGLVYDACQKNGIHVLHVNTTKNSHILSLEDQRKFVSNVSSWTAVKPAVYHGHFGYIDFSVFGVSPFPIYINLIRDPIERLVSYYYFLRYGDDFRPHVSRKRKGNRVSFDDCVKMKGRDCDPVNMWIQIPFFCGQSYFCWIPGSELALEEAKKNVISKYLVVGVTEEMGDFVSVLEVLIPRFFSGISNLYQNGTKGHLRKTFNKEVPSDETISTLRSSKVWKMEQEFYVFVRMQFHFVKRNIFKSSPGRPIMPTDILDEGDNEVLQETPDGRVNSLGLKKLHDSRPQEFFYEKIRPK